MSGMPKMFFQLFSYVSVAWLGSVVSHVLLRFYDTHSDAKTYHTIMTNLAMDCQQMAYVQRYPFQCGNVIRSPPPSHFWVTWIDKAFEKFSICGVVPCEDLIGWRPFIGIIVANLIVTSFMHVCIRSRQKRLAFDG